MVCSVTVDHMMTTILGRPLPKIKRLQRISARVNCYAVASVSKAHLHEAASVGPHTFGLNRRWAVQQHPFDRDWLRVVIQ